MQICSIQGINPIHLVFLRRMVRILLIICIWGSLDVLMPNISQAQYREWSLEECIQTALDKNLRLKQVKLQEKNAGISLEVSKASRYPNLNASANHGYNFGRTIDPFTNTFGNQTIQSNSFNITSSVVLFNGLQNYHAIERDKVDKRAAQLDANSTTNDIMLTVATLYLQVLMQTELAQSAKEQLSVSNAQLSRTKILTNAGRLSEGDVVLQEAQVASDELNLVNASSNLRMAYVNLWQSMDLWPDTSYKIKTVGGIISPYSGSLDVNEIFSLAMKQRPEVESAEKRLESAHLQKKIAEGSRYPRLVAFGNVNTLFSSTRKDILGVDINGLIPIGFVQNSFDTVYGPTYSYRTRPTPFGNQLKNNLGRSFGFSISVPIFNNRQTWAAIQRSQIAESQADINLQLTRQTLLKNISQAVADYQSALVRFTSAKANAEAQWKSLEFAKVRYENGAMSATDFNLVRLNYNRAESMLTQARYEYLFRVKVLDFYQGKPL